MICKLCGWSSDKKQRSNSQNKYYWSVVLERLSNHTGYTTNEIHEILKNRFLKGWKTLKNRKNEYIEAEYARSTTDLNTKEFEDYMTKVREFASIVMGCWIPEPNEQLTEAS